ncbi:hypothetical protein ACFO3E_10740 [Sphingobium tyrosinilyticum]|jgi:hypothetical protein|uniref:Uncharacterized protein n=1 Tax=Sphingobium tyrosinilyticum TaxID=2715436 RepID=A0ABV9F3Z0_9SPHN
MAAYQLPPKQHVGTTYKRALERFHHSREAAISGNSRALPLIESSDN